MNKIDSFRGKYYFLSNFFEASVTYNGITYKNNEAAFQSMKFMDIEKRKQFAELDPSTAKRKGRNGVLRHDWEDVKEQYMYEICLAKFTQNEDLKQRLLDTAPALLEEGNTWGDKEWGTVSGVGKNKLGKILMRVREELSK
jgi:ribA/ribD-fused uncharacterized protein